MYTKTFKYFQRYKEYIEPAFTFQQFLQKGYHHQHWKCNKCGEIFYQDHYYYTGHIDELPFMPRCLKCFPLNKKQSNQENSLLTFVRSIYNGTIKPNNFQLIAPKQLDIVLPDLKIAIQFNRKFLAQYRSKAGKLSFRENIVMLENRIQINTYLVG